MIEAKVLEDSISPCGHRLTTFEVNLHRFMLPELNTHRALSRNSASSRAIPVSKQLAQVRDNPAMPVSWPHEQSGMQGGSELDGHERWAAKQEWLDASRNAANTAELMHELGVHKSVTNRLLEPFMWHKVIISATDLDGFFEQRCSPLAQPEIRVAAELMRDALEASEPKHLGYREWHTPLIQPDEDDDFWRHASNELLMAHEDWASPDELRKRVSVARCARVSYLTHDGQRDVMKDLELYDRLVSANPPHWSPLEHVATPCVPYVNVSQYGVRSTRPCSRRHRGNFTGYDQLRHTLDGRSGRMLG